MDRPSVVLVNRCFILDRGKILAVQRSHTDSHLPGLWEVPGGKLDAGQDLSLALMREIQEETGYFIREVDTICHKYSYVLTKGKYVNLPYVVIFSIGYVTSGRLRLSKEHDAAKWCTRAEFMDLPLTSETYHAVLALHARLQRYL